MYSALAAQLVAVNRYDCSIMASMEPYILPSSNLHHYTQCEVLDVGRYWHPSYLLVVKH